MLGIGWTEMLVIGVVALIVIGPRDLPMLMQKLGRAIGAIRKLGNEFQREINKTTGLSQLTDLRRSIAEPLKKTTAEITREFNRVTPTGVEPTGLVKPADPKAQSVVNEIRAASGLPPDKPAVAAAIAVEPVKKPAAVRKVESPAPVEAIAPPKAAKPRAKKSGAPTPKAGKTSSIKTAAAKPTPAPGKPRAKRAAAPPKAES